MTSPPPKPLKPEDHGGGDVIAQYSALLDAAVDAVIVIDESGQIETFNRAAEEIFGYSADEATGRNVSMLMPEPHRGQHDQFIGNYKDTGVAKIIGIGREALGQRKNGEIFPIELAVGEAVAGDTRRFVGIIRDATLRKDTEERLRQMGERLAYLGRVNTLGEMSTGIAHEINQPLAAIGAYAQACRRFLAEVDEVPEDVDKALIRIDQEAQRAGGVIHRLRALASQAKVYRRPVDCNSVLADACELAELDARAHRLELQRDFAKTLPRVYADAIQIQQILLNLIRNAIDAMGVVEPAESRILVRTELVDAETVRVSVTDYGCGISPEAAARLFDPFFTTKPSGLGVGLSISKSIIEAHGGTLGFEANPAGGTVFQFTVPVAEKEK